MDLFKEMADDAQNTDNVDLEYVSKLAAQQVQLETEIANMKDDLKEKQEELEELQGKTLPDAMREIGLTAIQLEDGSSITITPVIGAHISKVNLKAAHDWLRENGFGDLIKNEIKLAFGKEEDHLADQAVAQMEELGFPVERKEAVHHSTLKAFVKEQLEKGTPLPLDKFGVFQGHKTQIK